MPVTVYEDRVDEAEFPVKAERMERKSSKELITFLASPVVATKIHDEDEKKFIDIQSIESMLEPIETTQEIG
jgi:hypothetical protein